jgi:hypothetical protein
MTKQHQQFLYREVKIHPSEADFVADKIAEFIKNHSTSQEEIESIIKELHIYLEEHNIEEFIVKTNLQGNEFSDIIKLFRGQEKYLRNIMVKRKEQYLNPEWNNSK